MRRNLTILFQAPVHYNATVKENVAFADLGNPGSIQSVAAAVDPWAEAEWLSRFRDLAQDRTVLIITHRFTTALFAEEIHVMEDGDIVESGRHEQLLNLRGPYFRAWHAQRRDRSSLFSLRR